MRKNNQKTIEEQTREAMVEKIDRELPIFYVWNYILEKNLVHRNAYKNPNILNGEIVPQPIDIEKINFEKDKRIPYYCFFHDTKETNSTNFVLASETDYPSKSKESKSGNFYSCFGCDHGGLLTSSKLFIVMVYGIDAKRVATFSKMHPLYGKALETLCALMGITYNDEERELSDNEKKELRFQEIYKITAEIYHENLYAKNPFSKRVFAYLMQERGFGQLSKEFYSLVRKLKIGCAPDKFDHTLATDQLLEKGFTQEELIESGVSRLNKDEKLVDFHRNGVIIPYKANGKFHNLYCRQLIYVNKNGLTEEEYEQKLKKRNAYKHVKLPIPLLHPVNIDATSRHPHIIIVEGEIDLATWLILGMPYVISVGGTNGLDKNHIHQLVYQYEISNGERCKTIFIALDEDGPGQKAVHKVANALEEEGNFDVRIIRLRYEDPDTKEMVKGDSNELFVKFGLKTKEIFLQLMEEAISYPAFKFIKLVEAENFESDTQRLGFVRRNRKFIDEIKPDEKLFLALEIANLMDVPPEWLIPTWGIAAAVPKTKEEPVLPPEALDKGWLTVFTDENMYNVCKEYAKNSVLFKDPYVFVEALKTHPNLGFIAFHTGVPHDYRDVVFNAFPDSDFRINIAKNEEEVKKSVAKKGGYISLLYKFLPNPYKDIVS
ncbi:hypothetical protein CN918_26900 [Priestia megaterium]|nr:hypothetical protein CN918_26900 [Priestia megaterium]